MRNTEKVRRSAAPNLLVQFPLAELTLQLAVDPSKSRRSILAKTDGRSRHPSPPVSSLSLFTGRVPSRMPLVTLTIRSVPATTKLRVSSGNKPAQYFIKAQAEKITSPRFLIGFFSKQVLFLAFHET
jgi:hypothetical protein